MESVEVTSKTLLPQTWSDWSAENLNMIANRFKGYGWETELSLHRLIVPLTPGRLGNNQNKALEISKRVLLGTCAAIGSIPTGFALVSGYLLTGLSNQLHSREYTYWQGKAPRLDVKEESFLHHNVCMFPGSLPYIFGGVRAAEERMDELFHLISQENPDIFFLCEFNQTLSEYLYEAFEEDYADFFVNIGPNAAGMDANMAVVSRVPILSKPQFIPSKTEGEGDQKFAYRGYFYVETKQLNYLYVHLHPKNTQRAGEIRLEQMDEIDAYIKEHENNKPWIILGDINIERGTEDHERMKGENFRDRIQEEHGNIETCLGDLLEGGEKSESIDGLLTRGEVTISTKIVEVYDKNNLYKALSDHKIISGKLNKND